MRARLLLVACATVAFSLPAHGSDHCGLYPDDVYEMPYSAWSDCGLKTLGERPLWRGLPANVAEVSRFVFTEGHGGFFRVVTITERKDGSAELQVRGAGRRNSWKTPKQKTISRRLTLSPVEVAKLKQLGEQAGAWEFERGTWDTLEGEEIYMHCQLLEMERANAAGYGYSSVNIGCNQPTKLMPLVDEIARLAKLERTADRKLYY